MSDTPGNPPPLKEGEPVDIDALGPPAPGAVAQGEMTLTPVTPSGENGMLSTGPAIACEIAGPAGGASAGDPPDPDPDPDPDPAPVAVSIVPLPSRPFVFPPPPE